MVKAIGYVVRWDEVRNGQVIGALFASGKDGDAITLNRAKATTFDTVEQAASAAWTMRMRAARVFAVAEDGTETPLPSHGEALAALQRADSAAPSTIARLLSLRVDLRDEQACAEITPEMAATYLRAKRWSLTLERERVTLWNACGEFAVNVPREQSFADYGRRMCEVVADVARAEERSPIAVWVDMMEGRAA